MSRFYILLVLMGTLFPTIVFGQTMVSGSVKDAETGQIIPGAIVQVTGGPSVVTDGSGNFSFKSAPGKYAVQISFLGYSPLMQEVLITEKNTELLFELQLAMARLDEVSVFADVARKRVNPVAFSSITPKKLEEELGGQSMVMMLNKTPGIYATAQGGGEGDAKVSIRGFKPNFVAVMIDGIPVNDMENGWVYWSNWFGLESVTREMQVQRGMGLSKLAVPSVGGTINILTKGIDSKTRTMVKQSIDAEGKSTTELGYTSGKLPGNWSITAAGSYKKGDGWVEATASEGWFYYLKLDKKVGKHLFSMSGMGAPQQHQQRSYQRSIATYDSTYAAKHGVTEFAKSFRINGNGDTLPAIINRGIKYNQHWGYITRDRNNPSATPEKLAEKVNIFHKPQFSLRDFWTINDKLNVATSAYLSIGKGGGTATNNSLTDNNLDASGHIDWQNFYKINTQTYWASPFEEHSPIDSKYSNTDFKSEQYIELQRNEHFWYGLITNLSYQVNEHINVIGGVDLRNYTGHHFATVYDLLGGDYAINTLDETVDFNANPMLAVKHKGDIVDYNEFDYKKWAGGFTQIQFSQGPISSFVNLSAANNWFKKKVLFDDTESNWIQKQDFVGKAGVNYNYTSRSNVYFNAGYISKSIDLKYIFSGYTIKQASNTQNQKILSMEGGYTFSSPEVSCNVNAYLTNWKNKPATFSSVYDDKATSAYVPMDARHIGIELDGIYKITHKLEVQGLVSIGNWIWNKKVEGVQYYYSDASLSGQPADKKNFDVRGIHVGDAAQSQLGASVRYEPIRGLYFSSQYTYFDRYYADFSPDACMDKNGNPHDSWMIPSYGLFDLNAGYTFKLPWYKKVLVTTRFNVINVFDQEYITTATNNDGNISPQPTNFDAASASVFFGMGRRYLASLQVSF